MYNIATLKTALLALIGFNDSPDSNISGIDSELTASSSGQYWEDFHPLLHTDNLYYSAPNFEGMGYSAYSVATYDTGDKVLYNSIAWRSKSDSNVDTPAVDSEWESCFSYWLREKTNASIAKLFNRLATDKKLSGSTKAIFSNTLLFEGDGKLSDTITKSSRVVGFAINPQRINNIQVVLNQLGLQFTVAQSSLPIYLWHSSRKGYVATQNVTTTGTQKFNWQALTSFVLDYVSYSSDIDSGGTWFIGYFEDDVTGSAVNKTYDFYAGPCRGCLNTADNVTRYNLWSKYVSIMPFYSTSLDGTNLPAIEDIEYDETTNFGLNLAITVKPDVTELIISNLHLITYPLGMQFANDMLSLMAHNPSTRVNAPQKNAAQNVVLYELSGDANTKGVIKETERAVNALAEDLSNISVALPQNKPTGIRTGAI